MIEAWGLEGHPVSTLLLAAGALLVREAGGVVTDFSGSDKVETSDSILAAPFKVMTPMRRIVEPRWAPGQDL